jgi:hypothetical protein
MIGEREDVDVGIRCFHECSSNCNVCTNEQCFRFCIPVEQLQANRQVCFTETGRLHNTRWTASAPPFKETVTDWPMNPRPKEDSTKCTHRHKNRDMYSESQSNPPTVLKTALSQMQKDTPKDLFQAVFCLLGPDRKEELENSTKELTLDNLTDGEEDASGVKRIGSRDVQERRLLKMLLKNCSHINVYKPDANEMKKALHTMDQHVRLIGTLGVSRLKYTDSAAAIKEKEESYFVHVIKRPDSVNPIRSASLASLTSTSAVNINFWKIVRYHKCYRC